jgi:hypothetical protein
MGCAKKVGQINGLARITTQTVRPGCVSLCARVGHDATGGSDFPRLVRKGSNFQ